MTSPPANAAALADRIAEIPIGPFAILLGMNDETHFKEVLAARATIVSALRGIAQQPAFEAIASLLKIIDDIDAYQKRSERGDWGVECACCMGELLDKEERTAIEGARALTSLSSTPSEPAQQPAPASPDIVELRKQAFELTPHEQYRLAFFIAENVGYILAKEPEHPDSPHASVVQQPAPKGWREIVEPAKDAYWLSRRNGKDETSALLSALDVAIAAATEQQSPQENAEGEP